VADFSALPELCGVAAPHTAETRTLLPLFSLFLFSSALNETTLGISSAASAATEQLPPNFSNDAA